ncbi:MAG: 4-deoxy-4-formamido-L-arabinose-phosphoundecaprenol deformylase [Planctomycetes bacterium]|nr:4-deoxy-4-formamido-L-arabinose-phosphoundecaprenol deformylase [Planctomycetota bacterium]MCB9913422.1 4-deoxy-4-formamido-L-arabinose-phosphoundecaprenol deformylase [Planctomycetota bacterium]HPF12947.1 polysaccharide deacetylase family protein [Planctomycetota bacterium]HRV80147.1 polysaccharide deacetylase family protein [Planctomycetota bacterium]
MKVGLRIDVDTLRGTRVGVPKLCAILAERDIKGSFFFSVGPDNMGRHLWRLLRPTFLWKMLRSSAPGLYGWQTVFHGNLGPGKLIGEHAPEALREAARGGHEIGFHAWDHHAWQAKLERFRDGQIRDLTQRGLDTIERITQVVPSCSASPGWRCNEQVLKVLEDFPLAYQSDCRGHSVFLPRVDGEVLQRPQIPVTLPTYDELIGRDGTTDANYNERLLERFDPEGLNVLTIHAEVEGCSRAGMFVEFLGAALAAGWEFVPLGEFVAAPAQLPVAPMIAGSVPGREGAVACQGPVQGTARWAGWPGPSSHVHAEA